MVLEDRRYKESLLDITMTVMQINVKHNARVASLNQEILLK